MTGLDLAALGNCTYGGLVDRNGRVVWACLPRFDSDPIFCSLLDGDRREDGVGFFDVVLENHSRSEQRYLDHTAILSTTLYDAGGDAVEIIDFAPRFRLYDRYYRPTMLVRLIKPVTGTPRIRIRLRPASNYAAAPADTTRGSNHIRYLTAGITMRLTTTAPVSYVQEEVPFVLDEPLALLLGPDESLTRSITETARELFEKTHEYWSYFTRHLSIPFEWQEEVIRAAITLKLCSYEDSGAIIAAMTTSVPEAPHTTRNWDYRFCWLRDSYFVVHALNRLGASGTLERYLRYITNLAVSAKEGYLQPVYGINLQARLTEREIGTLPGYRGMGPVRVGNKAYEQVQNDGYGSAVLSATHVFFDRRFPHLGSQQLFERLERLGEQAARRYDQPDAGLWEFRASERVHTFSSVMCWAACDRLAKIAARLRFDDRARYWRETADRIHAEVYERAWNGGLNRFVSSWDGDGADASLLLLHELGFVSADDPRFASTVDELASILQRNDYLLRYTEDEFGVPTTVFTVCTFWYIDALVALGRREEARNLFEKMLKHRNHVGLLSEDFDPVTGELWGNFPQTYSMVGLINSAMKLSKKWEDAF